MALKSCSLFALIVFFLPVTVSAQVFKCTDSAGKLQYSDAPCASDHQLSTVRIYTNPTEQPKPVQRMSAEAKAHEEKRQALRASTDESHRRIDDAAAKISQIRTQNYDPRKCAAAKAKMAQMERNDPLHYQFDLDYAEFKSWASLYCGN